MKQIVKLGVVIAATVVISACSVRLPSIFNSSEELPEGAGTVPDSFDQLEQQPPDESTVSAQPLPESYPAE